MFEFAFIDTEHQQLDHTSIVKRKKECEKGCHKNKTRPMEETKNKTSGGASAHSASTEEQGRRQQDQEDSPNHSNVEEIEESRLIDEGPSPRSHHSRIGKIYHATTSQTGRQHIGTVPSSKTMMAPPASDEEREATWGDVLSACCCHSIQEWTNVSLGIFWLLLFLYFFLVGLDWLGTSFKVVGGCTAGSMLGSDTNPLAGVMIGIIATSLLQSSSTTTSIVVSLVGGGLDVKQGIYLVMGANVGTR